MRPRRWICSCASPASPREHGDLPDPLLAGSAVADPRRGRERRGQSSPAAEVHGPHRCPRGRARPRRIRRLSGAMALERRGSPRGSRAGRRARRFPESSRRRRTGRSPRLPVTLTVNGRTAAASSGRTLFDLATGLGVRVPTSCQTNGKCKECVVEIAEGLNRLSPPTPAEKTPQRPVPALVPGVPRHRRWRRPLPHDAAGPDADRASRVVVAGNATGPLRWTRPSPATAIASCSTARRSRDRRPRSTVSRWISARRRSSSVSSISKPASRSRTPRSRTRSASADPTIMARIRYDTEHPGKLLRRTVAGYVTHAIEDFPVDPSTIYEMVVVGNSTMRDLFFRQNVYSIGQTPYRSITEIQMAAGERTSTVLVETGRRCLLPIHPRARVYGAPIVSGHVGADAAACMLAIDLAHEDRRVALMDIGTNTELVVGNRHRILAASCPAGPAFEGGAIACGMPALDGAIEDVALDDAGGVTLGVIGGGDPQGICGSGLIDVLSELRRTGRMNEMGRFEDGAERIDLRSGAGHLSARKRRQRAGAGQGRERRRPADRVQPIRPGLRRHRRLLSGGRVRQTPQGRRVEAHRPDSQSAGRSDRAHRQRRHRGRLDGAPVAREAPRARGHGAPRRALPPRDAPGLLRFLRRSAASSLPWTRQRETITRAARASSASEPRDRSTPTKRRARARVGESEGRSPSEINGDLRRRAAGGGRSDRVHAAARLSAGPRARRTRARAGAVGARLVRGQRPPVGLRAEPRAISRSTATASVSMA